MYASSLCHLPCGPSERSADRVQLRTGTVCQTAPCLPSLHPKILRARHLTSQLAAFRAQKLHFYLVPIINHSFSFVSIGMPLISHLMTCTPGLKTANGSGNRPKVSPRLVQWDTIIYWLNRWTVKFLGEVSKIGTNCRGTIFAAPNCLSGMWISLGSWFLRNRSLRKKLGHSP